MEQLINFVENRTDISENTKKNYIYTLSKMKNYRYNNLEDTEKVIKYIDTVYSNSVKIKVLNLLVSFFKNTNPTVSKEYYDKRNGTYRNYQILDKSIPINPEKIHEMPDDNIKLFYILLLFYPNFRLNDYFSLKIHNYNPKKDNYINKQKNKIIFNSLVKSNTTKLPFVVVLSPEHTSTFKKILINSKEEFLRFHFSIETFKRKFTEYNLTYFNLIGGVSKFRKYQVSKLNINKDFKNDYYRLLELSKQQNHTLSSLIEYYL